MKIAFIAPALKKGIFEKSVVILKISDFRRESSNLMEELCDGVDITKYIEGKKARHFVRYVFLIRQLALRLLHHES